MTDENERYVQQIQAVIQQKTSRRYNINLSKLGSNELLELQRLLRDIEDEARSTKSKIRKRGFLY